MPNICSNCKQGIGLCYIKDEEKLFCSFGCKYDYYHKKSLLVKKT